MSYIKSKSESISSKNLTRYIIAKALDNLSATRITCQMMIQIGINNYTYDLVLETRAIS